MFKSKIVNGACCLSYFGGSHYTHAPHPLLPPPKPVLVSSEVVVKFAKGFRIWSVPQSVSTCSPLMWKDLWEHRKFGFSALLVLFNLRIEQKSLSCPESI